MFLFYDYCERIWGHLTGDGSLTMQWLVLTLDQEVLHHFWFLCSLPDLQITHAQVKHIWVHPSYIPSDMVHSYYYRNTHVGRHRHYYIYSCEFPWSVQHQQLLMGMDSCDTLERCLTCVSFIFYMITILNPVFTHRTATVCTFEIQFF